MTEREFAVEVVRHLQNAGFQALWAGGCVRDEVLGLVPKDYDVATDARPEQVRQLFRRTLALGAAFGVIEVLGPRVDGEHLKVQVATFRSDGAYIDGRRPESVVFSSAREDALRRDFTINGMFCNPLTGEIIDYVGGQEDLRNRLLRAIGDPRQRIAEDKLRMLRAVRLASRFELQIEPQTWEAIRSMADQIVVVSAERIAEELRKTLIDQHRARGMELMMELGLVKPVLPELMPTRTLPQGPPAAPTCTLWEHTLQVLAALGPSVSFPLALAALLHDIGKPRTVGRTPDRYTFYSHEHVGRRLAGNICLRLKLSNEERERVEWLVEKHQFLADAKTMRTSKLKETLAHPGIRELLALHRADAQAWGKDDEHVRYCEQLLAEWRAEDLNPAPLITGHDLMRIGLTPGPQFKELLDAVREAQLDGTIRNSKQAMDLVQKILRERMSQKPPTDS